MNRLPKKRKIPKQMHYWLKKAGSFRPESRGRCYYYFNKKNGRRLRVLAHLIDPASLEGLPVVTSAFVLNQVQLGDNDFDKWSNSIAAYSVGIPKTEEEFHTVLCNLYEEAMRKGK